MTCILPTDEAEFFVPELISILDSSKIGKSLKQNNRGKMMGILLTEDGSVFYSYSGNYTGELNSLDAGFVPPCYDYTEFKKITDEYQSVNKAEKSRLCLSELNRLYEFNCFDGKIRKLTEITENAPSGTGDCCAPRLLSHCYKLKKKPLSMCEFYYGDGNLIHGNFYTPCENKCRPILKSIIGLDIVYFDNDIVVLNKQPGLLSVPGVNTEDSIMTRVKGFYKRCISQPSVHRLDMDTSGLIVMALTETAHNRLSAQFEERKVRKTYTALVKGLIKEKKGIINLPINRVKSAEIPTYTVGKDGKESVTYYELVRVEKKGNDLISRITFSPVTGRTHQIRVHCLYGLGTYIVNDRIYSNSSKIQSIYNGNLALCATSLSFRHPITGKDICFNIKEEF